MKILLNILLLMSIILIFLGVKENEKYKECSGLSVIERDYCMEYLYGIKDITYKELLGK